MNKDIHQVINYKSIQGSWLGTRRAATPCQSEVGHLAASGIPTGTHAVKL